MDRPGPPSREWQQQPPYPVGFAPSQSGQRWFPIAVVVAILISGALIAAAIVFVGSDKTPPPTAAPSTAAQPAAVPLESTATCEAWRTTLATLEAIPALPAGADYNTPNIDTLIANANAAVERALVIFQSKIAPSDPPQIVSAAHTYIGAKRNDMAKTAAHTVTEADDTAVDTNLAIMKQLCAS